VENVEMLKGFQSTELHSSRISIEIERLFRGMGLNLIQDNPGEVACEGGAGENTVRDEVDFNIAHGVSATEGLLERARHGRCVGR
jgi:hypothetical protein